MLPNYTQHRPKNTFHFQLPKQWMMHKKKRKINEDYDMANQRKKKLVIKKNREENEDNSYQHLQLLLLDANIMREFAYNAFAYKQNAVLIFCFFFFAREIKKITLFVVLMNTNFAEIIHNGSR